MNSILIYKLLREAEWAQFQDAPFYAGTPADIADGYIHFSTAAQLKVTARKHFTDEEILHVLGFDPARLGPLLKWEPSRGGDLFPHLYGPLSRAHMMGYWRVAREHDGFNFPKTL